jgi:hypothetical protein
MEPQDGSKPRIGFLHTIAIVHLDLESASTSDSTCCLVLAAGCIEACCVLLGWATEPIGAG